MPYGQLDLALSIISNIYALRAKTPGDPAYHKIRAAKMNVNQKEGLPFQAALRKRKISNLLVTKFIT